MDRHARVLAGACLAAGLLYVAAFLWVGLARAGYPYDLEWMEGGCADHVGRVRDGLPLYAPPSLAFTSYVYTPLYYHLGAIVSTLTRPGLLPLRLLSLAAAAGSLWLIGSIVRGRTGSLACGLAAAGLHAATFRLGGAWADLARVDSLFLFLTLCGLAAVLKEGWPWHAASAALFFLAFFTKQSALPVALAIALAVAARGRGAGRAVFPGVLLSLVAAGILAMQGLTGGWFGYYVWSLPRRHVIEGDRIWGFWTGDLGWTLPIALAGSAWGLAELWRREVPGRGRLTMFLAGMLATAWVSRIHSGGYDNVLIPAHAALAIFTGLALGSARLRAVRLARLGWAGLLVQLVWLAHDPREQIPGAADREAGGRLVRLIESTPGDVWVPMHGHLASLAGKRSFAHAVALDDVFRVEDPAITGPLETEIREALRSGRFGAIVLDYADWGFATDMRASYEHAGPLFREPGVLLTRTGYITRPQELFVRAR